LFLKKLLSEFSEVLKFYVNPSVMAEIERTVDPSRRGALLKVFKSYEFTSRACSFFPFSIPFSIPSQEDSATITEISQLRPSMKGDLKIVADAFCNSSIDILLTSTKVT